MVMKKRKPTNGSFKLGHSKSGDCGAKKGTHNSINTEFKKGSKINLGRKHKIEQNLNHSYKLKYLSAIGAIIPSRLGKKNTEEQNRKAVETRMKNGSYKRTEEFKKRMRPITRRRIINGEFPNKNTSIEIKIQNFLKQLNIEFFTHQYIKEIEHSYQCDILIPSMNLVIECDGNYWHKYPIGKEIDHIRTKELIEKGFKVLRLWESEIRIMSLEKFKEKIT